MDFFTYGVSTNYNMCQQYDGTEETLRLCDFTNSRSTDSAVARGGIGGTPPQIIMEETKVLID